MSDSDSAFDAMLREAAQLRVPLADALYLPEVGECLQEKYRIEERLGAGGMGAVFRATNLENNKQVAIKWLLGRSSKACARFSREGQLAAQIDHPNVVNVFDLGTHRGGHFLVMELLRGQSLGKRLRDGRLAAAELVAIMLPILRGLRAAHAANVIHRDLKPDNVFLCVASDGTASEPKVLDFGVSKLRHAPSPEERLTSEGTGLGTPAYMSPEQLNDAPSVDERTDIYAAGVMMYEALTGRLPFRADSHHALVLAIAAQRPIPIRALVPEVDERLERIVLRAMAREAAQRYGDVQALIDELDRWLCGAKTVVSEAARGSSDTPRSSTLGKARSARAPLVALLVAAAALVWYFGTRTPSTTISTAHVSPTPRVRSASALHAPTVAARAPAAPLYETASTAPARVAQASTREASAASAPPARSGTGRSTVAQQTPVASRAGPLRRQDL